MSNQNFVFVVDTDRKPLVPCKPGVARSLLDAGKAAVLRTYPFTIALKKSVEMEQPQLTLKIDPGSKVTGFALLLGDQVVWGMNLEHRGHAISKNIADRAMYRRSRRSRKTRYRKSRFNNRSRPDGWLPPSIQHRVDTIETWIKRCIKFVPIGEIVIEKVKFDMQLMRNPDIKGEEYQQGTLHGYNVRQYLLEKWGYKCAYCNKPSKRLEVEHVMPRSKGGSNSVTNLVLACEPCNKRKGTKSIDDFVSGKADLQRIKKNMKASLKDAATVNASRNKTVRVAENTGVKVSLSTGAQTAMNRSRFNVGKDHWKDAAVTGDIDSIIFLAEQPLIVKASRNNCRQAIKTDKYGFPARNKKGELVAKSTGEKVHGFQTGDIVQFVSKTKTKNRPIGTFIGRVSVRSTGNFNVSINGFGTAQGVSYKTCRHVQKYDGYTYGYAS